MAERWRNRGRRFQVRIEYVGMFGAASYRRPWAAHLDRHIHTRPKPADDRHQAVHRETAQVSLADAREIGRGYPGSDLRRTDSQPLTVQRLDDLAGQNCLELQYVGILDAQIPKRVPATADQVQLFTLHCNASFKRFRRCLTTSISR